MDRRTFLRWVAGAAVAPGVSRTVSPSGTLPPGVAWRRYSDRWISYVTEPPYGQPGLWTLFTTTCRECPAGCGMQVRTREGRVIKPEGNPAHPVSRGGLCPRGQSAPQGLYDPDRVRQPLRRRPAGDFGVRMADVGLKKASETNPPSAIRNPQWTEPQESEPLPRTESIPLKQFASVDLQAGFEPVSWPQAAEEVAQTLKKSRRLFILSDLQTGALAEVLQQFYQVWEQGRGQRTEDARQKTDPSSGVVFYEAFDYEPLRTANEKLFGQAVLPRYRLQECDFILSLGAEFLETWVSNVEFAWEFARMHHGGPADRGPVTKDRGRSSGPLDPAEPVPEDPSKPYPLPPVGERPAFAGAMAYLGPRLSMTAANADSFVQVRAGQEVAVALAILQEVVRRRGSGIADFGPGSKSGVTTLRMADLPPGEGSNPQSEIRNPKLQRIVDKLSAARNPIVLPGPTGATGPVAERLALVAMELNQALGAIGKAVDFAQTHALGRTTPATQVETMLRGLGPQDALIVHQTNPVYSLPHLRETLGRVGNLVFIGPMMNETARLARWVLPTATALQEWGDYEPWTGLHCLIQPTMGRMYEAKHSGDVFLTLAQSLGRPLQRDGQTPTSFLEWLRLRWRQLHQQMAAGQEFEAFWREALQRGGVWEEPRRKSEIRNPKSETNPNDPNSNDQNARAGTGRFESSSLLDFEFVSNFEFRDSNLDPERADEEKLYLWLWPSILWFDGHLANRGWLQEVPDRMSTLTWGSWVDLSPATAQRLKIERGDVLEVSNAAGTVRAPARITDEVADNVVALALGQGHTALGLLAAGRGANGFALLRPQESASLFGTVELRNTKAQGTLINLSPTQDQWDRDILRWTSPRQLRQMTQSEVEKITWPGPAGYTPERDLYGPHYYPKHRWAMVIDLDRCIGCGACSVACYAENTIPVMGPAPLAQGREMNWLRVPPYKHPREPLRVGFLPLPCQHCDAAPCEPVCPVFAAVHNEQGLNAQIYNRCIGTRYCSNNCPYKVRRFGWFDPHWREPLHLQFNPDVTVRCRGVMEKCTFCIQRIHYHERLARIENRPLRDGEIQPACVQSCPTRTFVFGDLMQPDSEVYRLFHHPRRYQLLKTLNTKPAVIYLKRILPDDASDARPE